MLLYCRLACFLCAEELILVCAQSAHSNSRKYHLAFHDNGGTVVSIKEKRLKKTL
jgi:hypothetical protein